MKNSSLLDALKQKNPDEALYLIETHSIDPNEIDLSSGMTPLHLALEAGYYDIAKRLLALPQFNLTNHLSINNAFLLHFTIKKGLLDITEKLLERGIDVNLYDNSGETALHSAVHAENQSAIKLLLKYKANITLLSTTGNMRGATPIHFAIYYNNPEILEELLSVYPGNIDTLKGQYYFNKTPLSLAIERNSVECADILLKHHAKLNKLDKKGSSPLYKAFKPQSITMAKLLIHSNADLTVVEKDKHTALHYAINMGNAEIVKLLLSNKKLNPNAANTSGETPLHLAASKGFSEIITLLLAYNTDINQRNNDGFTPLHLATQNGHLESVTILLDHHAKINLTTDSGFTPHHLAAQNGHLHILKILSKYKADFNQPTPSGYTPLHFAAVKGHLDTLICLLEFKVDVNQQTVSGLTPLHLAAKDGHFKIIEVLLAHNAKVDLPTPEGLTPLHFAAQKGCSESIKKLLKHQADINAPLTMNSIDIQKTPTQDSISGNYKSGSTPLHIATLKYHLAAMITLLDYGAKIQPDIMGNTPLHIAASGLYRESQEMVRLLLTYKADMNYLNKKGISPFHMALREWNTSIVPIFLAYAGDMIPDVNLKDDLGRSPLHIILNSCTNAPYSTSNFSRLQALDILLAKGAKVDIKDNDGFTSLHLAAEKGDLEIFDKILTKDATIINAQTQNGATPLHYAAMRGHLEILMRLLAKGAKVNLKDVNGKTPLHLAAEKGHLEILSKLYTYGADPHLADKKGNVPFISVLQQEPPSLDTLLFLKAVTSLPSSSLNTALVKKATELLNSPHPMFTSNILRGLQPLLNDYSLSTLFQTAKKLLAHYPHPEAKQAIQYDIAFESPLMLFMAALIETKRRPSALKNVDSAPHVKSTFPHFDESINIAIKAEKPTALKVLLNWREQAQLLQSPQKAEGSKQQKTEQSSLPLAPYTYPKTLIDSKLHRPHFTALIRTFQQIPSLFDICLNKVFTHTNTAEEIIPLKALLDTETHPRGTFIEKEIARRQQREPLSPQKT